MSNNQILTNNGWDRTFLNLSSKLAEPFCASWHLLCFRLVAPLDTKKFENCSTLTKEIATRSLIGLGALFSAYLCAAFPVPVLSSIVVTGLGSRILRSIGFSLQQGGYTHVRGEAAEKSLDSKDTKLKLMSWNICGVGGGMSLDHGGVIDWRSRLDRIVEKIKNEDPDVLVLEEIYDAALAEALINRLKADYAHFFTHLGPNVWGSVSGCMVLSKCKVHRFSYTPFTNNQWALNRGFATLEVNASPNDSLPCARIIGTHLIHGDDESDKKHRAEQLSQIVNSLAQETLSLPTIMTGDFNMERDQEEGALLSSYLHHAYLGREPTCTNRLVAQWDNQAKSVWGETIDYISYFKRRLADEQQLTSVDDRISFENCHLVRAFDDTYNTKTALSDHHGIFANIELQTTHCKEDRI